MIALVLDADGAIKLARAGVLESLASLAKCFIPRQVYKEILIGKEKMYEDAFIISGLVERKKIKVVDVNAAERNWLGAGETQALAACKNLRADAIVSDDRKFLSVLEEEKVAFLIPTDAIVLLSVKKAISKTEALIALNKLRRFVREENYDTAIKAIGGE